MRLCALTLKDDIFFSKCMHKQNACMALILNIILKNPGISMKDVNDQEDFYHLASCSIRLYVLAQTKLNKMFSFPSFCYPVII